MSSMSVRVPSPARLKHELSGGRPRLHLSSVAWCVIFGNNSREFCRVAVTFLRQSLWQAALPLHGNAP